MGFFDDENDEAGFGAVPLTRSSRTVEHVKTPPTTTSKPAARSSKTGWIAGGIILALGIAWALKKRS